MEIESEEEELENDEEIEHQEESHFDINNKKFSKYI